MRFKVVSYNIWHGAFLDEVITFVNKEEPDIVCMQEMATHGRSLGFEKINIFDEIRNEINMKGEFAEMFQVTDGKDIFNFGESIFARHGLKKKVTFRYAGDTNRFHKQDDYLFSWPSVVLGGQVSIGGRNIQIFTTHLPVTQNATVTQRQIEAANSVRHFVDEYDEFILCGDMNALPSSKTYKILSEGLVDVTDSTKPTLHPTIHKVGEKGYHVDYVFYRSDRLKHLQTTIPIVDASDHLPVVAEFELEE